MREIVAGLLWIGNARDLREPAATLAQGAAAVVDLAASEPVASFPRDILYCRLPLCDGAENSAAMLGLAVSTTVELLRAKIPVLAACSMGMSRSPAIAAAALARVEGRTPDEMLARVAQAGPLDVDPALWRDLKRLHAAHDPPASDVGPKLRLLVVRSEQVERLLRFYAALGLIFVEERHGQGPRHHSTTLGDAVFEIYPATTQAEVDVSTRLGFQVAELAAAIERLRAMETPLMAEPKDGPWGRRAVVRDPDGRAVELYERGSV